MKSVPYFKSEAMNKVVLGIILVLVVVMIMMIKFWKKLTVLMYTFITVWNTKYQNWP